MRLKNKAITDPALIDALHTRAGGCRLGMCRDNGPCVVPMNSAHEGNTVYLHCARAGKRYEILQQNPNGCSISYKYQSLIANGNAQIVGDEKEKERILELICQKYLGKAVSMPREGINVTPSCQPMKVWSTQICVAV